MVFCGKTAITTFKLIQNAKSGGVLENSGYLLHYGHWDFQNWRRNAWENEAWSCQPPLQKSAEFTAHIMHSFDDPLHFHDLQWKQNLFHTLVEGKVKVVLHPWPDVSSSRTITPSRMAERINQCILWAVNSVDFLGGVGNFMLHFLSHFFFNIENLSAHLVANILNFPIHPQHLHFGWVWG